MHKDDTFWLNAIYVIFFLLSALVVYKTFETIGIQSGWSERFEWFDLVTTIASIAIGGGVTWWLRAEKDRHDYFLASIAELRRVTWPTWAETKRMTIIVVIVVGVFAVILGVFDMMWTKALKFIIA